MKKSDFGSIGKTSDGKLVISGIYKLHETWGVPLSEIFNFLIINDSIPSWIDLYKDMRLAKIDHHHILVRLKDEIDDSFGLEWGEVVIQQLKLIFETHSVIEE